MRSIMLSALVVSSSAALLIGCNASPRNAKDSLQGVWVAQSMEVDGKPAPAESVKRMRFTFKGEKLFIRGNFDDDREEESTFKIDPSRSPKHLDFTPPPPNDKKPVVAIYDVNGDELKVCLRHSSSSDQRPTEFASKADSKLVLMVLKKQTP